MGRHYLEARNIATGEVLCSESHLTVIRVILALGYDYAGSIEGSVAYARSYWEYSPIRGEYSPN